MASEEWLRECIRKTDDVSLDHSTLQRLKQLLRSAVQVEDIEAFQRALDAEA